ATVDCRVARETARVTIWRQDRHGESQTADPERGPAGLALFAFLSGERSMNDAQHTQPREPRMAALTVRIPPRDHALVKTAAQLRGISMGELIRQAVVAAARSELAQA